MLVAVVWGLAGAAVIYVGYTISPYITVLALTSHILMSVVADNLTRSKFANLKRMWVGAFILSISILVLTVYNSSSVM